MTQGAVSQQVKSLELELGVRLFNRGHQKLTLTDSGRQYQAVVRDALDRISFGTERLVQRQTSGILTVSTSPDFAAKWLVHRLSRFAEIHPGTDLRVSAAMHHVDFSREDVDVAVRHGDGIWAGLDAARLADAEELFPVCSPRLISARGGKARTAELLKVPLLHLDSREDWSHWLAVAGMPQARPKHGPVMNRASMLIDAAVDGQGVALARTTLAARDLLSGRLVRPFAVSLPLSKTYWVVCPEAASMLPKIVRFRDWLIAEAADDKRRLDAQRRAAWQLNPR